MVIINLGYHSKEDNECFKLFTLAGVFVKKESSDEQFEGNIIYPFSLTVQKIKKIFLTKTEAERDDWLQQIQEAVGYSNLFAFYDIKVIKYSINFL